jgi:hypothetical protein
MWNIVNGSETIPSDDTTNATKHRIWIKKDNLAKAMITQCIKADLVIKVAHAKHAKESWDIFLLEYSQTGSGSIMLWFRRLNKQLPSGGNVSTHVMGYQEAIRYLANTEFNIPGYIAAAILLLTLPSNPRDPHSWNQHVAGVKIDKSTTTLSSVVNGILEEKRRRGHSVQISDGYVDNTSAGLYIVYVLYGSAEWYSICVYNVSND